MLADRQLVTVSLFDQPFALGGCRMAYHANLYGQRFAPYARCSSATKAALVQQLLPICSPTHTSFACLGQAFCMHCPFSTALDDVRSPCACDSWSALFADIENGKKTLPASQAVQQQPTRLCIIACGTGAALTPQASGVHSKLTDTSYWMLQVRGEAQLAQWR